MDWDDQNGSVSLSARDRVRCEIEEQISDFLQRGGKITEVKKAPMESASGGIAKAWAKDGLI